MSADAPWITHCITAVRYIIAKSTGFTLPYTYIGDLLCDMVMTGFAWARLVPLHDHERGDLLFFHRRSPAHKAYMITHVGIFVDDAWNYFHSSNAWWIIENISSSLIQWTIVSCELAMRRTDPRTTCFSRNFA
jgi:cell wall-associated NlpC family hydrolase